MFRRTCLWSLPVLGAVALGVGADRLLSAVEPKQDLKPAASLPLTQVVLFNSGVGYFARGGEVEGEARVDLTFPETDINDLLKSMVLQDFNKGRVAAVSYDSREPIARTLSSFAIDLNDNPSLANILAQARGERVEVTTTPTATNQPGKLVGTIVGIESQKVPAGGNNTLDVSVMNMWCAEGLRSVKLPDIQQLRFSNPTIETEFRRALEVLALSRDSQKKSVSLHFAGEGRRKVQVGYVIEAPIWKASYRLVMSEKEKPYLQGWAMVENPTDEDWSAVKMALVAGRPISFRMDLYNPLYVPRPTVEPELFASLRPPTYAGGFARDQAEKQVQEESGFDRQKVNEAKKSLRMRVAGAQGGVVKELQAEALDELKSSVRPNNAKARYALEFAKDLQKRLDIADVASAATAGALGDFFQYVIDHPVSLSRQKSALLPIVGKDVEGTRVSIYNATVQAKHPLLGLRFKNTSGLHLAQGPITVFEGSTYAGDTRVLDVQPNEERLLSYAIDLGTEVVVENGAGSSRITSVKAVKGIVTTITKSRGETRYKVINRSQTDRTLVIEHPNRTNQQFKLVDTDKPVEDTADVYRFQMSLKAGEQKTFPVNEERDTSSSISLSNSPDDQIRFLVSLNETTPALKAKLGEVIKLKGAWDGQRRELQQVVADLQRLNADQDRIRKNLRETPKEAEVYTTYLKKLSDQEKEIDALTAKQKTHMADEFTAKKAFDDYLANLTD